MPIFRYPFFYNNYYGNYYNRPYPRPINHQLNSTDNGKFEQPLHNKNDNSSETQKAPNTVSDNQNNSKSDVDSNSNYFFELFGLKLYFDDVLLICLIFFLYQEGVKDDELFISLILLLLS